MSAFVLISGILHRDPVMRTAKTGRTFMTAFVRCETGESIQWCNIVAFAEAACAKLMRLHAGESVNIQGGFKVSVFEAKDGTHKAKSLDIVAASVLPLPQPNKAASQKRGPPERLDSQVTPFDDAPPPW